MIVSVKCRCSIDQEPGDENQGTRSDRTHANLRSTRYTVCTTCVVHSLLILTIFSCRRHTHTQTDEVIGSNRPTTTRLCQVARCLVSAEMLSEMLSINNRSPDSSRCDHPLGFLTICFCLWQKLRTRGGYHGTHKRGGAQTKAREQMGDKKWGVGVTATFKLSQTPTPSNSATLTGFILLRPFPCERDLVTS